MAVTFWIPLRPPPSTASHRNRLRGRGSGLSINGQRGRSNSIVLDGADNNGQLNGNVRLTISQEAVQEFQVVTNQFSPEFGNASGGLINIISRGGYNDFHGDGFPLWRNEVMDARNAFFTTPNTPPFRREDYGATLGGPIRRNKTFFFASSEYLDRNQTGAVTISSGSISMINQTLARRPIPNSNVHAILSGIFSNRRVDHPQFDQDGSQFQREGSDFCALHLRSG